MLELERLPLVPEHATTPEAASHLLSPPVLRHVAAPPRQLVLQHHVQERSRRAFPPAPAQRYWRDARVFRIFEGTSEIQHEVIARRILEDK